MTDAAPRLTSTMRVSSLIRGVNNAGGSAMVLKRGDDISGAILIACTDRGVPKTLLERVFTGEDYGWQAVGPAVGPQGEGEALDQYLVRRRTRDHDLWIIELDIPDAERFVVETLGSA